MPYGRGIMEDDRFARPHTYLMQKNRKSQWCKLNEHKKSYAQYMKQIEVGEVQSTTQTKFLYMAEIYIHKTYTAKGPG